MRQTFSTALALSFFATPLVGHLFDRCGFPRIMALVNSLLILTNAILMATEDPLMDPDNPTDHAVFMGQIDFASFPVPKKHGSVGGLQPGQSLTPNQSPISLSHAHPATCSGGGLQPGQSLAPNQSPNQCTPRRG